MRRMRAAAASEPRSYLVPTIAGILALAVTVLVVLLVPFGGSPAGGARGGSVSPTHLSATSSRLQSTCKPSSPDSPVVAYVTYQHGFATSPTWLAAVDLPSGKIKWRARLPHRFAAESAALNPNGRILWVAAGGYERSVELLPVHTTTGDFGTPIHLGQLGPTPEGLAISPNGAWAIVAHSGAVVIGNRPIGSTVTLVDLSTRSAEPSITVGFGPAGVAFSPDSRYAYVSSGANVREPDSLQVIDVDTRQIVHRVSLPQTIPGVTAVSPTGNFALVGNLGVDLYIPPRLINVVDLHANHRSDPIRLPRHDAPSSITFDCSGSAAFAQVGAAVVRIDMRTRRATYVIGRHRRIGRDGGPSYQGGSVAATPDGEHLWVAAAFDAGCPSDCHGETQFRPLAPTASRLGPPVAIPLFSGLLALGPVP